MLLSHIPLTQVGDPNPAGRAPGRSGEGESHQSEFFIPFFRAPLGVLWNAAALGSEHGGMCARFNPLLPKDLSCERSLSVLLFRTPTTAQDSVQSLFTTQTLLTRD